MLFREKLAEVEATQWFPPEDRRHTQIEGISDEFPAYDAPDGSHWHAYAVIRTIKDSLLVNPGDWVVVRIDGSREVLPANVFERRYEVAS